MSESCRYHETVSAGYGAVKVFLAPHSSPRR